MHLSGKFLGIWEMFTTCSSRIYFSYMYKIAWDCWVLNNSCTMAERFDTVAAAFNLLVAVVVCVLLKIVQFLLRHALFFTPGPPKHFTLRQFIHVPRFGCWYTTHYPQWALEHFWLNFTGMNKPSCIYGWDVCVCSRLLSAWKLQCKVYMWETGRLVFHWGKGGWLVGGQFLLWDNT